MQDTLQSLDIVGLGACGIDLRARVPRLPHPNTKTTATDLEISDGGVTANNLVQAAKLGLRVAWLGGFGNDGWKDRALDNLASAKVVAHPIILESSVTQQFWIMTDPQGSSLLTGIPGATRKVTAEHVRADYATVIHKAKHFHTEVAVLPLAAALEGARIAHDADVTVLVDIDDDPWYLLEEEHLGTEAEFRALLALSDVVKLSEKALLGLMKNSVFTPALLQDVLRFGPKLTVVTRGASGSVLANKESTVVCPSMNPDIHIVDTVGAGDAFMGGLSYGILQGWDIAKIGRFANACGVFTCTQFGTRSFGTLQQIEDFLAQNTHGTGT